MTICTYNASTLVSEASVEDLMMQARKIKYDVIGLTETRRHHPLHAAYDSGEELFLGTCNSRGVGGVALTAFVAYAPTSDYDDEEIEAFYVELEKFYKEDHTYKVIVGDFNAKIGPRRSPEELHIGTHGLEWNEQGERLPEFMMSTKTSHGNSQFQKPPSLRWTWESPGGQFHNEIIHIIFNRKYCPRTTINWDFYTSLASLWEDTVVDNIDEEYDHFVHHLRDSAKGGASLKTTKRRLPKLSS
ncbi:unnamed protein product [Heligmosomoides polygyrus]|uniref:Endo/exonuclease/phosphatase domain-containing protein n=1 Tax=Heligmosomoides polygyrus TaxID=6339 RepID=A0A183FY11_HELPZ|nr:unnamed protein product [Heligmosomoides polygyrus]